MPMQRLGAAQEHYTCVAFAPDSRTLVAGTGTGSVQGWQVADGTPLPALPAHPAGITTIAVTPQGQGIVVGFGNGRISVTAAGSTATPLERVVAGDGPMTGLRFSPNGRYLAAWSIDSLPTLWQLDSGAVTGLSAPTGTGTIAALFTAEGRSLVALTREGPLLLWPIPPGRPPEVLPQVAPQEDPLAQSLAVSADGIWIAAGRPDGRVDLWERGTRALRRTLVGAALYSTALAFAPRSDYLAASNGAGSLCVWRVADGMLMSKHARFSATVAALRFAPDGQELWGVTAAGEGWRWAWAMEPQATIHADGGWERPQSIVDVAWAADGRAVALVDGAGALWLWYPVPEEAERDTGGA